MSDLYAWQRIAVLGLNNHSGSLPISENIAAVYPDKSEADPVKCFLDLAALTYGSNAFASLPEKEGFDELPALPSESLATISDGLAKQFQPYLRKHVFHGLLFALFQKNLHIPERWLQTSLKACQNDSSLTEMLRAVISEKLRWLAALNPEWHKVLNTDDRLTHLPLSLQLIALEKLPPENLTTKTIENWAQLTPTNSVHWLSYCHQASEESLNSLLALSRKERSRKTRRVLLRLLAVHDIDELQTQASKLLENFLSSKSKVLRDNV
ncbi:MAG: hypothetical protein GQ569_09755, partial [Methylococcaceae bacterium]|nr:hypothetical protein [Methylococcaceae bacterium]